MGGKIRLEQRILLGLTIFVLLSVTIYHFTLDLNWLNAFYFVITTLTTVGYGDISLLNASPLVKIFGTIVMVMGAMSVAVLFGMVTDYLLTLKFEKLFGKVRSKMKNHTILIGWNKTAQATLDELHKISEVTLVTRNKEAVNEIKYKHVNVLIGDGTDDEILTKANIKHARTIITCDDDDSRNIMTVLMVKKLNPNAKIISSANEVSNMRLIKEAGAYEVISPDVIGGRLITSAIFEQKVVDLIKDATFVGKGTNIEQITVAKDITVEKLADRFRISVMEKVNENGRISNLNTKDTIYKGETAIVFGYIKNIKQAAKALTK